MNNSSSKHTCMVSISCNKSSCDDYTPSNNPGCMISVQQTRLLHSNNQGFAPRGNTRSGLAAIVGRIIKRQGCAKQERSHRPPPCSRPRRQVRARQTPRTITTADLTCERLLPPPPHSPGSSAPPILFIERRPGPTRLSRLCLRFPPLRCALLTLPHRRDRIEPSLHLAALRSLGTRRDTTPFAGPATPLHLVHAPTTDAWRTRTTTPTPTPTPTPLPKRRTFDFTPLPRALHRIRTRLWSCHNSPTCG